MKTTTTTLPLILLLTLLVTLLLTGCSKEKPLTPGSNITTTTVSDVLLKENCYQIVQKDLYYFKTVDPLQNKIYCDTTMCCVVENNPDGKCLVANCIKKEELK